MQFPFSLITRQFGFLMGCLLMVSSVSAAPKISRQQVAFFESKIRPVLVRDCYKCHSAKSKKVGGELLLDTRQGLMRGGESGPVIDPRNVKNSLIIEALRHDGLEMPPKKKLSDTIIANFERWIRMGAPDPRGGKSKLIQKKIDYKKAREHWAYRPRKRSKAPVVKQTAWPRNDIDRFVLAKLESKNLKPVADAEKQKLIRRIYFDLIGIPPTPTELQQVLDDNSSAAIEKLIDRLLASEHFGERWGRHWLDVVRYGESTGMERNYSFSQAWRYRDYVINAFNTDKPYTQFIREQLAGDLLNARNTKQKDEYLIATGMLAIGTKSLNERNKEKFLMDIVDDQIDVTCRAFLGLTASCARCHDHKFDPIAMEEYYALAGIFRSTETFYGTGGAKGNRQAGRLLPLSSGSKNSSSNSSKTKSSTQRLNQQKQRQLAALRIQLQVAQKALKKARSTMGKKPSKKNAKGKNKKKKNKAANNGNVKQIRKRIARIQRRIDQLTSSGNKGRGNKNSGPMAMAVADRGSPADCKLRIRGEATDYGPTVPRGMLTIATIDRSRKLPNTKGSGRLQLASWITTSQNPLTARVMVNRIWHHLYGQGIVRTVNNFGKTGEMPANAELLDHLANRFESHKWSVKKLIREIMLSRTYQLSGDFNQKNYMADPENRLNWRMNHRRMDAEAIRDAILAASGKLDRKPSVGSPVSSLGGGQIRNVSQIVSQDDFYHRSVYLPIIRGVVPEILKVFDFPEPSIMSGRRDTSTVPTQALYFLNSKFVLNHSKFLADRILTNKNKPTDDDRISLAYQLTLCRKPSEKERSRANQFLKLMKNSNEGPPEKQNLSAWTYFCQALIGTAEFRYIE